MISNKAVVVATMIILAAAASVDQVAVSADTATHLRRQAKSAKSDPSPPQGQYYYSKKSPKKNSKKNSPLTPEEECEQNSDSTGYRWCERTQTCDAPGDDSCFTTDPELDPDLAVTDFPTKAPLPTDPPTDGPTDEPTGAPTEAPTDAPTSEPTTSAPTETFKPSSTFKPTSSSQLCPTEGGCNRPKASKSNVKLTAGLPLTRETAPEIYASDLFPVDLKDATQKGVDFVRTLIGSASHASLFFYEQGGLDSSYDIVNEAWCEKTRSAPGWCNDGSRNTQTAKSTDQWGEFFMSKGSTCRSCNNETTHNSSPLAFIPGKTVSPWDIELRAVHEYVHAWQSAFTDQTPNWLVEGGAVFLECVYEANQGHSFSDCFKFSGGRGGIVRNVRTIYSSSETKWLTNYGDDRCCGSDCPDTRGDTQNTNGYYDVGALAIAFAIHKANATMHDKDDSRTLLNFWTSTDDQRGFWHSIYPWDGFDQMISWPSDVPEGFGWKAALANFTGHSSVVAFYEEFENWVAPGGIVRSEDELLSILESDADVFDMSRIPASFSCFTVRDGACGGPSSPTCPTKTPTKRSTIRPSTQSPTVGSTASTTSIKMQHKVRATEKKHKIYSCIF